MGQIEKHNLIKMWIGAVFRTISGSCLAILPVFYLRNGLTEVQISFVSSLSQTVSLIVSLSCSGIAAYYKDSRKPIAVILLIQGLLSALYTIFGFVTMELNTLYVCILSLASLLAVISSLFTIFDYKLPCEIMEMKTYSTYCAYSSLISGIAGMGINLFLPILYSKYTFSSVASGAIVVGGFALIVSAFLMLRLKPISGAIDIAPKQKVKINPINDIHTLFKNHAFRFLFIPNILRGFGSGMLSIISLIAIRYFSMADGDVSLITAAANIGVFLSSFLYIFLVKHIGIPKTGLVGGLLFGVICLAAFGNSISFLVFYCVAQIGLHMLGNAIPSMIYCSIE